MVCSEDAFMIYLRGGTETVLLQVNDQAIIAKQAYWSAIRNLQERDWFKRLWIIQEIQLAAQAVMNIGYCNISWPIFHVAFQ